MERTSSFGYWLRRRRKALELTQEHLARQVGCSVETIKKIETDVRRPSRQMAERMVDCLAIPPEERAACQPDVQKFCEQALPDTMRVLQCLQANRTRISRACRQVLERHGQ